MKTKYIIASFFILCVLMFFLPSQEKEIIQNNTNQQTPVLKTEFTQEKLTLFRKKVLIPKIVQFINGKSSFSKINRNILNRKAQIVDEFNSQIQISFYGTVEDINSKEYQNHGTLSSKIDKLGKPSIDVNTVKLYKLWVSSNELTFNNALLSGIHHELIHLDLESNSYLRNKEGFDGFVQEEMRAWEITVLECLVYMKPKTGDLFYKEYNFYINKSSDQEWKDFIRDKYSYRK